MKRLYLTETLTTELRLTAQRLLGYQCIRTNGTCVDLIVYQVVEFQIVHISDSNTVAMLLLAVATSIDALAVGITFAFLPGTRIVPAVALIGKN